MNASVTHTAGSPHARLAGVPVDAVSVGRGFWHDRMEANRVAGIPALHARLEREGVVDNFRRQAGSTSNVGRRGLWFTDSDLYKWMEGAAWSLATTSDPVLEARLDEVVESVAGAQAADGYLNTAWSRDDRYTFLSASHELYCAGHLFQAAVAHHRVTGDDRLLDVARRFADHLVATFGTGRRAEADGHPEVEMALVELGRETGERAYVDLARFFLDQVDRDRFTALWGHAVRAQYYCAGLVDVYSETGAEELRRTALDAWASLIGARSYVTGGVGGRWIGESVGRDYELPNESSYAETCAGIASVFWAWRHLMLDGDAQYADALERALHNAVLVGMSLRGDEWSYVNPLATDGGTEEDPWIWDPLLQAILRNLPSRRTPWHECTCCPPNLIRLLASLPGYFYSTDDRGLWVHLYAPSSVTAGGLTLTQRTDYPWDGQVEFDVRPVGPPGERSLYLRIPGWCARADLHVNDVPRPVGRPGTYAEVRRDWQDGDRVALDLSMPAVALECHPRVRENRDAVALCRGPLVYCLESIDQPDVDVLEAGLAIDRLSDLATEYRADLLGGVAVLRTTGRVPVDAYGDLYQPLGADRRRARRDVDLTAIPYFAWANRGPSAMTVWMRAR
jgi:DUF1680 family protein